MRLAASLALACVLLAGQAAAQQQIQITPQNVTTINGSVTITTGNTFQQVLAAAAATSTNASPRRALTIQNNNTNSDNCWIAFGTSGGTAITAGNATKAESILLAQGGSFQRYEPFVPSDAIIGTCASNSDTLYVDTQ
jgi:hypothetical protein